MSETLTGRTTRPILFADKSEAEFIFGRRYPAGTTVYVTENRGKFIARIPHTLYEQYVSLIDVEPF